MVHGLLPFNWYSIHSLLAASFILPLTLVFWFIYGIGYKKKNDIIIGNILIFMGIINMCLFLLQNSVPSGLPSTGWFGGPHSEILSLYTLVLTKICWISGSFFCASLAHYSIRFYGKKQSYWIIRLTYVISIVFSLLLLTDFFFEKALIPSALYGSVLNSAPWSPKTKPQTVFLIFFFMAISYTSSILLYKKYKILRKANNEVFRFVKYNLLAFIVMSFTISIEGILTLYDFKFPGAIPIGSLIGSFLLFWSLLVFRKSNHERMIDEIKNRKEVEKRLKEASRIILSSPLFSFSGLFVNGNFQLTFVSDNVYRILGYKYFDIFNQDFKVVDLVAADDWASLKKEVQEGIQNRYQSIVLEPFRLLTVDKSEKWFNGKISVINQKSPNCYTLEGVLLDVTEIRQLETQLFQAQKMEAVGQLAGGIAHDFNNILQSIKGYCEILLYDAANDEKMKNHLLNLLDTVNRAKSLINQLLSFSRKNEIKLVSVDINDIVRKSYDFIRHAISKNIDIFMKVENCTRNIHADIGQIEQVLMNLCINARDAILDIESDSRPTRIITIETYSVIIEEAISRFLVGSHPGHYVVITVSDNGKGIDGKNLTHIFEPFYTTKQKEKGTGLGLSTVYSIVQQHHGFIDVKTEQDLGTTFYIYLPLE